MYIKYLCYILPVRLNLLGALIGSLFTVLSWGLFPRSVGRGFGPVVALLQYTSESACLIGFGNVAVAAYHLELSDMLGFVKLVSYFLMHADIASNLAHLHVFLYPGISASVSVCVCVLPPALRPTRSFRVRSNACVLVMSNCINHDEIKCNHLSICNKNLMLPRIVNIKQYIVHHL